MYSFLAYYVHRRSSETAYFKQEKKSIEMELLINSNSNSWEILLTIAIAIAIVPKMSIAIVISILLISSGVYPSGPTEPNISPFGLIGAL